MPLDLPSQVVFYFPGGKLGIVEDTPETPCIRANRFRLKSILSTGVDIHWGKKASRFEETVDKVTVHFEDGTSASGDVVVGADGTFSAGMPAFSPSHLPKRGMTDKSKVRPHVLGKPNEEVLQQFPCVVTTGETKLEGKEMEQQLQNGHSSSIAIGSDFVLFSGLNRVKQVDGKTSGDYYWVLTQSDPGVSDKNHWSKTVSQAERLARAKEKVKALKPELRVTVERTEVEGVKSTVVSVPSGLASQVSSTDEK